MVLSLNIKKITSMISAVEAKSTSYNTFLSQIKPFLEEEIDDPLQYTALTQVAENYYHNKHFNDPSHFIPELLPTNLSIADYETSRYIQIIKLSTIIKSINGIYIDPSQLHGILGNSSKYLIKVVKDSSTEKIVGFLILLETPYARAEKRLMLWKWGLSREYYNLEYFGIILNSALTSAFTNWKIGAIQYLIRESDQEILKFCLSINFKQITLIPNLFNDKEAGILLVKSMDIIEKTRGKYFDGVSHVLFTRYSSSLRTKKYEEYKQNVEKAYLPFLDPKYDWDQESWSFDYIQYIKPKEKGGSEEIETKTMTVKLSDIFQRDSPSKPYRDKGNRIRFNWKLFTFDVFEHNKPVDKQWTRNIPINKLKTMSIFFRKKGNDLYAKLDGWIQTLVNMDIDMNQHVNKSQIDQWETMITEAELSQTKESTHDWISHKLVGIFDINEDWEFVLEDSPLMIWQKSAGQLWEKMSCEGIEGCHKEAFVYDITHSNVIAFIRSKHTNTVVGRFVLRWCECGDTCVSWGIEAICYCISLTDMERQLPFFGQESILPKWNGIIYAGSRKCKGKNHPSLRCEICDELLPNTDGTILSTDQVIEKLYEIFKKQGFNEYHTCSLPYVYGGWSDVGGGIGKQTIYTKRNLDKEIENIFTHIDGLQCPICNTYLYFRIKMELTELKYIDGSKYDPSDSKSYRQMAEYLMDLRTYLSERSSNNRVFVMPPKNQLIYWQGNDFNIDQSEDEYWLICNQFDNSSARSCPKCRALVITQDEGSNFAYSRFYNLDPMQNISSELYNNLRDSNNYNLIQKDPTDLIALIQPYFPDMKITPFKKADWLLKPRRFVGFSEKDIRTTKPDFQKAIEEHGKKVLAKVDAEIDLLWKQIKPQNMSSIIQCPNCGFYLHYTIDLGESSADSAFLERFSNRKIAFVKDYIIEIEGIRLSARNMYVDTHESHLSVSGYISSSNQCENCNFYLSFDSPELFTDTSGSLIIGNYLDNVRSSSRFQTAFYNTMDLMLEKLTFSSEYKRNKLRKMLRLMMTNSEKFKNLATFHEAMQKNPLFKRYYTQLDNSSYYVYAINPTDAEEFINFVFEWSGIQMPKRKKTVKETNETPEEPEP